MGNGMADYIIDEQFNRDGVASNADYDLYCHYVAGVVGEGLTSMAIISKFGSPVLEEKPQLHESMGLFLQKTNIMRDYREDMDDGRSFWPRETWGKYTDKLGNFVFPQYTDQGLYTISDLTINSLKHVTDVLEYLSNINEPSYFRFCAIPQVMSIATLELVFNNSEVFQRNIKIRRGMSAKLILNSTDMNGVYKIFRKYVRKIHLRNRVKDPNFLELEILCGKIEQYIEQHSPTVTKKSNQDGWGILVFGFGVLIATFGLMVSGIFGASYTYF